MRTDRNEYNMDWKATPSDRARTMPKPPVLPLGKVLKWAALVVAGIMASAWMFHNLHGVGNIL